MIVISMNMIKCVYINAISIQMNAAFIFVSYQLMVHMAPYNVILDTVISKET